jgi:dihydropyrimidinase
MYPRKGTIAIGADADITIWDPQIRRTIRHAELHDAADYSPYEGFEVTGWPETVILRGIVIVEGGTMTARAIGTEVPRGGS